MYSLVHITSNFLTILLCLLSVFVVLGNLLVVSAIWHENQLHTVTNYLIASLAAADCLVGALVMPFSVISEIIIGSWTFGPLWCDLWHSFDVLASTASIMNLCAISLDRYLAITDPISYPTRMTPKRVALLIASLWTCSSLISFPAILWWRAVGGGSLQQFSPTDGHQTGAQNSSSSLGHHHQSIGGQVSQVENLQEAQEKVSATTTATTTTTTSNITTTNAPTNHTHLISHHHHHHHSQAASSTLAASTSNKTAASQLFSSLAAEATAVATTAATGDEADGAQDNLYKCVFTDNSYYLLFSSFISFYGPLCIMLYAYYQIYTAAVQQTRFLKYGSKQIMMSGSTRKGKHAKQSRYISECISGVDFVLRAHRGGAANNSVKLNHNRLPAAATTTATTATGASSFKTSGGIISDEKSRESRDENAELELQLAPPTLSSVDRSCPTINEDSESGLSGAQAANPKTQMLYYDSGKLVQSVVDLAAINYIDCAPSAAQEERLTSGEQSTVSGVNEAQQQQQLHLSTENPKAQRQTISNALPAHRQHKSVTKKLSKLAKERKAAKTLGIVVGVFILCWLPFFVINIIVAVWGINSIYNYQVTVLIFTWLGWLNSAMNPVIYACWSREFRRAFRRVLCSWVEFLCPYDGARLARKLKLKESSNYSAQETSYLNRNISSIKANTSSATTRSNMSMETSYGGGCSSSNAAVAVSGSGASSSNLGSVSANREQCNSINGSASRSLLSDQ